VDAADEGVFACLRGMLAQARGGDPCPLPLEAAQWLEKTKTPRPLDLAAERQKSFAQCSLTPAGKRQATDRGGVWPNPV
jgi:hypothetical protein